MVKNIITKCKKVKITFVRQASFWYANNVGDIFVVDCQSITSNGMEFYQVVKNGSHTGPLIHVDDCVDVFDIQSVINGGLIKNPEKGGIDNGKFLGYAFSFDTGVQELMFIVDSIGTPLLSTFVDKFQERRKYHFKFVNQREKIKRWFWAYTDSNGIYQITSSRMSKNAFECFCTKNDVTKFEKIELSLIEE